STEYDSVVRSRRSSSTATMIIASACWIATYSAAEGIRSRIFFGIYSKQPFSHMPVRVAGGSVLPEFIPPGDYGNGKLVEFIISCVARQGSMLPACAVSVIK